MINFIIIVLIAFTLIFIRLKHKSLFNKVKSFIFISIVCIMVFYIVLYPSEIIEAARSGIFLWANTVLPSLLPFFIGAELLVGLGVVKFIGVLIEPIIRPIFNVPGEASFVFAMSITSGYPMGVKLTSDLRKKNAITKMEAQRILSFCSTSGPLFMIGSVAIGMFNNPNIGPYIIIPHYLGVLTVGIIYRFIYSNELSKFENHGNDYNILRKAVKEMFKKRRQDGRSLSKLLSDSVTESISTLVLVGGLIVTFSVITKELYLIGFFDYFISILSFITKNKVVIPNEMVEAILTGSIEITMGCKITSEAIAIPLIAQITLATMIISWSGLSVHAQSASILNDTDININSYVVSKFLHSIISGVYAYTFLKLSNFNISKEAFSQQIGNVIKYSWINKLIFSSYMFLIILITLLFISLLIGLLKKFQKTQ